MTQQLHMYCVPVCAIYIGTYVRSLNYAHIQHIYFSRLHIYAADGAYALPKWGLGNAHILFASQQLCTCTNPLLRGREIYRGISDGPLVMLQFMG